jgi:hypothetical protein
VGNEEAIEDVHAESDDFTIETEVVDNSERPLTDFSTPFFERNVVVFRKEDRFTRNMLDDVALFGSQESE